MSRDDLRGSLVGLFPILLTPFRENYELDVGALRDEIEFVIGNGLRNLVLLGTQGEFFSVTTDERKRMAEAAAEQNRGRANLIVGVSHSDTLAACDLARHARSVGTTAVMATPPYYATVGKDEIFSHFDAIAEAAQLPLILYNASAPGGLNLTPAMLVEMASHQSIIAVKQASLNVTELEESVALAGKRMIVIGGSEAMMWPCLALGMPGCTSTASCAIPEPFQRLMDCAQKGKLAEGTRLYMELSPFRLLCKHFGSAAVVKVALETRGLRGGPVRPPLRRLTGEERELVHGKLKAMKLI